MSSNKQITILPHDELIKVVSFNIQKINAIREIPNFKKDTYKSLEFHETKNSTIDLINANFSKYIKDAKLLFNKQKEKRHEEYLISLKETDLEKYNLLIPINKEIKTLSEHKEKNSSKITKLKADKKHINLEYRIKKFELKKRFIEDIKAFKENIYLLEDEKYHLIKEVKNSKFLLKDKIKALNSEFRTFKTLIQMFFQDKVGVSYKSNVKSLVSKIFINIFMFAFIIGASYLFYYGSSILGIFSIGSIPIDVPAILNTVALILMLVSSTIGLTKMLYFSSDQTFIKTLPIKPKLAFYAKIVVYLINEIIRSFKFIIPLILGYAIYRNLGFMTFIWAVVSYLPVITTVILLSALISIPLYFIMKFFNNYPFIKTTLFIAVSCVVLGGVIAISLKIPTNIDMNIIWSDIYTQMQGFFSYLRNNFNVIYYITEFHIGTPLPGFDFDLFTSLTGYVFLTYLLIDVVLLVLLGVVVNPIYFKLTSSSTKIRKEKTIKNRKNTLKQQGFSQICKDFKLLVSDSNLFSSFLSTFILLPIIILLINKIFGALNTALFGNTMVIAFNILIILLITLNSNVTISKLYSAEGNAFRVNKTYPLKPLFSLSTKLILPMSIGIISTSISLYIFTYFSNVNIFGSIFVSIGILFTYIAHMIWSAYTDILNPTVDFGDIGAISKNEAKTITRAFLISFIFAGFSFILIDENFKLGSIKFMLLGLGLLIFIIVFYFLKIKYIYERN